MGFRHLASATAAAICLEACALPFAVSPVLVAQEVPAGQSDADAVPVRREARRREPTRLYFAMGTVHLKSQVVALHNNWVAGLSGRGFFGATFLNSYGHRAFTGGLQRTLLASNSRPVDVSLSCRLGFVTGYDGRLMPLARKTPVLPLLQPVVTVDVWHIGAEISYTFVVLSTALSYRF